ncbi:hypothetical protein CUR86_06485 [Salinicola acroporae]|uniref:FAS1 domain-containing protein n=1 Tax=Salinicola acroporae TaxID=1541440 RepID=A0ABT6I380_9GAMM|nr:hypothetical protein [Salinicola acroporae]
MGSEDQFSASYIKAHVVEGKTNANDIKALYGAPDDTISSGASYAWEYDKSSTLSTLQSISGMIPGASSVSGAFSSANSAQDSAQNVSHAADKASGSTERRGDEVIFWFDSNDVVSHWSLM